MNVRNYRHFEITPLEKLTAAKALMDVRSRVTIPYWLAAGTALGLYRDNDFIDGDTDIDIECVYYDGIEVHMINQMNCELIRDVYVKGKPQQLAFMLHGVIIDFYIYHDNGENYINHSELGDIEFPKWMVSEQRKLNTKYGQYYFPKYITDYLQHRYGDWRTPRKNDKGILNK